MYVATVNKTWRHAYGSANAKTSVRQAVASVSRVRSVLPFLKSQPSLNNNAFFHASKSGNVCVLERLLANKRPRALYTCAAGAVAGGNLETLSWAVANLFPLDRFVCHAAASAGNLKMLKWAVSIGCPWEPARCSDVSGENGHLAVQTWIKGSFLDSYATK